MEIAVAKWDESRFHIGGKVDHHRPPKLGIQCEVIPSKRRLHNQGPTYMSITFLIVRFATTIVERGREKMGSKVMNGEVTKFTYNVHKVHLVTIQLCDVLYENSSLIRIIWLLSIPGQCLKQFHFMQGHKTFCK
jgi:hypothetical protein